MISPDRCRVAVAAMREHAERAWPEESVGVLVEMPGQAEYWYLELENVADDPEAGYAIEDGAARGAVAIVHSHPSGAAFPSRSDMESQIAAGVPYAVVPCADGAADVPFWWPDEGRPYLGRPYRAGVTDCWTLVRDWYRRERGIALPPQAYEWRWDVESPELDLFRRSRAELGWRRIEPAAARPGDLVLLQVDSTVPNHAGVLLDEGLMLHHPSRRPWDPTSLSRREPASRYARWIVEAARPPEAGE